MNNRNQIIVGVVATLLVGAGLGWYYLAYVQPTNTEPAPTPNQEQAQTTDSAEQNQTTQSANVAYSQDGFQPSKINVPAGTTVVFANESDGQMWVASNVHPSHEQHPDFDALRGFSPGEEYTYTFEEPGTYKYHNHITPDHTGTIIVE